MTRPWLRWTSRCCITAVLAAFPGFARAARRLAPCSRDARLRGWRRAGVARDPGPGPARRVRACLGPVHAALGVPERERHRHDATRGDGRRENMAPDGERLARGPVVEERVQRRALGGPPGARARIRQLDGDRARFADGEPQRRVRGPIVRVVRALDHLGRQAFAEARARGEAQRQEGEHAGAGEHRASLLAPRRRRDPRPGTRPPGWARSRRRTRGGRRPR